MEKLPRGRKKKKVHFNKQTKITEWRGELKKSGHEFSGQFQVYNTI